MMQTLHNGHVGEMAIHDLMQARQYMCRHGSTTHAPVHEDKHTAHFSPTESNNIEASTGSNVNSLPAHSIPGFFHSGYVSYTAHFKRRCR